MAQNPLQQYFRQPKIYISLPSHGAYNKPGSLDGDVNHMPVFGMTGMDEILMKTPDALLSGESITKIITSCCPGIKDANDVNNLDIELILTAIRIATYGNKLTVSQVCPKCSTENEYELDLNKLIDHYASCNYDNKVVLQDLIVMIRPLTYAQSTAFSLRNFQLQQKLKQVLELEENEERKSLLTDIFNDLAILQNDVFVAGIESVDTGNTVVTERSFITEWIENCDSKVIDDIKHQIQQNQSTWAAPAHAVICENCGEESAVTVDLDQASFFENA